MKSQIVTVLACLAAVPAFAQTDAPQSTAPPSATPPADAAAPAPDAPPEPAKPLVAPPAPIQAQTLRAPDLFSAEAGPTGLPQTLWSGTSADLARLVLPAVAQKPLSPAAAAFARRLFGAGGQAPDGAGADADLAAARIEAVLSLGDPMGAQAMLAHTPGVAASPSLSQAAAETDLVLGQEDQACQVGDALSQGKDSPYFRRLRAYCLLRAGQNDAAQLTYDLAEAQAKDATYKRLMSAAVAGTPPGDPSLRSGLDLALSKHLMLDLTPAVDKAWAPILTVMATSPAYPDALRAAAAAKLKASPAGQPADIAAPVLIPLQAGDLRSAQAARTQIERNDASGATVLELALLDAALTTAAGRADPAVMDQLIERGTAGDPKDRATAQQAAALYAAEGAPMSGQARAEFASFELPRPPAAPARLLEMQLAAAPGDAVLLALWIAADAGAAGPSATERAQIVQAMVRAGFAQDARAYALEGLLNLLAAPPPPKPPPPPRAPVRRRRGEG